MMELTIVALGVLFNFNNARVFRNINIFILSNIFCNINIIVIPNLWLFIILEFFDRIIFSDDLLLLDKKGCTVFQKFESFFSHFVFK